MKKIYIALGIAFALICGFGLYSYARQCDRDYQAYEEAKADTLEGAAELALTRTVYEGDEVNDVHFVDQYSDERGELWLQYECVVNGDKVGGFLNRKAVDNYLE